MAEEAVRGKNLDAMLEVCGLIVAQALEGDKDSQRLVWQAMISKGSVDDRANAKEKVEITINSGAKLRESVEIVQTQTNDEDITDVE